MSLANIIAQAMKTRDAVTGIWVTYARGDDSVRILATPGKTDHGAEDLEGAAVGWVSRDYILDPTELVLDGVTVTPERGDVITEEASGLRHEVLKPDIGGRYWRYSDQYKTRLRVFTKERPVDA